MPLSEHGGYIEPKVIVFAIAISSLLLGAVLLCYHFVVVVLILLWMILVAMKDVMIASTVVRVRARQGGRGWCSVVVEFPGARIVGRGEGVVHLVVEDSRHSQEYIDF